MAESNLSTFIGSVADLLHGEIGAELEGVTDRILTMLGGLSQ
jgi:hypothetical protein